jgi:hypothetical protein
LMQALEWWARGGVEPLDARFLPAAIRERAGQRGCLRTSAVFMRRCGRAVMPWGITDDLGASSARSAEPAITNQSHKSVPEPPDAPRP